MFFLLFIFYKHHLSFIIELSMYFTKNFNVFILILIIERSKRLKKKNIFFLFLVYLPCENFCGH